MRSLREPKALTIQPMRCRNDQNIAEILSKRSQQNSFQVVHFTSARRFDDGQESHRQAMPVDAHASCFLGRALNFRATGSFDFSSNVVDQRDQRLLFLPNPDSCLHNVHAMLKHDFINDTVISSAPLWEAHTDSAEPAKPSFHNARVDAARLMYWVDARCNLFGRFRVLFLH